MYKEYFGLKEDPFSIAPDPQFLYMSDQHREALAHLIYGMKVDSGFVLLTGEVGTGKTTVCRCLLGQIPADSEVAFVLNPKLTVLELLATLCDELGIEHPADSTSVKQFVDRLNVFLLEAHSRGKKTVLIIDEAQNLSTDVLEQIRLLTNLETDKRKLLQVVMLGQPELNQLLERPELRQLAQRVTARYHLEPLSRQELAGYLTYRLGVAGVERPLFSKATIQRLYRLSGGVPRLINLICDRALLGAYVRGENLVSPRLLSLAAAEVFGKKENRRRWRRLVGQAALVVLLVTVAAFGLNLLAGYLPVPWSEPPAVLHDEIPVEAGEVADMSTAALEETPEDRDRQLALVDEVAAATTRNLPLEWFAAEPQAHNRQLAYRALFALWGHDTGMLEEELPDPAAYGLALLAEKGSLARLRQFNHPAVLSLVDPQGEEFLATLAGLDDETATLVVGSDVIRVPLTTLLQQWYGDYALLWQPPPDYQNLIRPGDQGNAVMWLEYQLAELSGRESRLQPDMSYDDLLIEEVRRFQRQENLDPDGVAGPYTLIILNSRLATEQPRLFNRQG
ncbi:MAG: AAA family ATPase [Pelovirga sp.]